MTRSICLLLAALAAPTAVFATEHEVAAFGRILDACYVAAQDGAHAACIGGMSRECMDGQEGGHTTLGIISCTLAEARVWDKLLNQEYQEIFAGLATMDKDEAEFFPEFAKRAESLREAQRAWIVFRDAECGLAYAMWGSGSMRNIASATCQRDMTAARTIELKYLGSDMR